MILTNGKQTIRLRDKPFARGGEGCIYDVVDAPDLVAKIYHPVGRTESRRRKIAAMLAYPPEKSARGQTAWPLDVLFDKSGLFVGFLMPRIKQVAKIDILYSYDNRSKHTWKWYIQIAQNLCAAVNSVHKSGHCIGDLNPANICVEETTGLVTLVDTDSYHINSPDGRAYPCVVCMPAYVPGELHRLMKINGFDLRRTNLPTFSQKTDLFALAIHIFALLMNGCHPYACSVPDGLSASSFTLIKNIERGYFPFVKSADQVGVPKYAPYLTILPQRLNLLMIKVFTVGSTDPEQRPGCQEWYDALDELEQLLTRCQNNNWHQYLNSEASCPWCKIERSMRSITTNTSPVSIKSRTTTAGTITAVMHSPTALGRQGQGLNIRPRYHNRFWDSTFGTLLSYLITFVIWSVLNVLAQWGIAVVLPSDRWWGWILHFLLFGIVPFLPTWLFYFWGESSLPFSRSVGWAGEILIGYGKWLALVVYGITAVLIYWPSGLLNTIFGVLFVCSPILLVMKLLPSFAGE